MSDSRQDMKSAIIRLGEALSLKHKRFADFFLANGENGTRAYLSTFETKNSNAAAVGAAKLLKREDVKAYVNACKAFTTEEVLNHLSITDNRILDEEAKIAFFDIRKILGSDGELIDPKDWPEEVARACNGVEVKKTWNPVTQAYDFTYKIKLEKKGQALKRLETIRGMFKLPGVQDNDRELFKSFLESIDGESRGVLPSQMDDE